MICAFQGQALERKRCTLPFLVHPSQKEGWDADLMSGAGAAILDHNRSLMLRMAKYEMEGGWVPGRGEGWVPGRGEHQTLDHLPRFLLS